MLAAVAAMAFVGVGSASAQHALLGSVVCHLTAPGTGKAPCVGSDLLPYTGLILALSLTKDVFKSGFATVECHGHITGEITNAGALEVHPLGFIRLLTWKNCTANAAPCLFNGGTKAVSAQPLALPWHITLLGTATLSIGQLHVKNPEGLFLIECNDGTKRHCIYRANSVLSETLSHTATTPAEIHTKEAPLARVALDGLCSAEGKWTALYELLEALTEHTHAGGVKLHGISPKDLSVHLL